MRGYVIPAAFAAVVAASSLAFAAQTVTGTVKSYSAKAHTIALEDGTIYMVPKKFKNPGLKPGTKVSIVWETKKGKNVADKVTVVK